MSLSMYQASVPVFLRQLGTLSEILKKGAAHDKGEALLEAKLADDMFALTRQVQIASDAAKGAIARLGGVEPPVMPDEEKTFADLQARIEKTIAFIKTVPADKIDGSEDRKIEMKLPNRTLEFTGQTFLLHFSLPNFFFHVTTAYAILRHSGVGVGKMDYLGSI